jgi:uncharacterized membrane protein
MEIEIENIHLATLLVTATIILYSDHEGFNYMTGRKVVLSTRTIHWSHRLVWAGLILMLMTGVVLILESWAYYLQEPVFYLKMGFVLILILNAFAIGKLSRVATERAFFELTGEERRTLLLSGVLSAVGWFGAAGIGLFFL